MNGERFLEAINRLPLSTRSAALRSFAETSQCYAREEALFQVYSLLYTKEYDSVHELSIEHFIIEKFMGAVLPTLTWSQRLHAQSSYQAFLKHSLYVLYPLYKKHRSEVLLRQMPVERLCDSVDQVPGHLAQTEYELQSQIKHSITDKFFLYSCYQTCKERWKHQFYTRQIWILLMWGSLFVVAIFSLILSSKGNVFNLLSSLQGWFDFLTGRY